VYSVKKERVSSFELYKSLFIFPECLLCTCVFKYVFPEIRTFGHSFCSKLLNNLCFLYNLNYLLIDYDWKMFGSVRSEEVKKRKYKKTSDHS
jgi:hypothetical protein